MTFWKSLLALLLLAGLMPLTADDDAPGPWTFTYKEGQTYTYSLNTQVHTATQSSGIVMDPNTYEMAYYPGEGFNRSFNISATLEFSVEKIDGRGNAKGKARFTDLYVTAGVRVDKPKRHAMSIEMIRGELEQKNIEADNIEKHEFRFVLHSEGHLEIKGNVGFLSKSVGKLLKRMNSIDNMFSKRHKEMLSSAWWENYLNMHFFSLEKDDEVPGTTNRVVPLFLGEGHGVVSKITDDKEGCPIELVSLTRKDEYSPVQLTTKFNVNITTGGGNTQQFICQEPLVFIRDAEGHLTQGTFKGELFYQSESSSTRVVTQAAVTSILKFEGKRDSDD